jgi:GNAT superfamily N-acetyltransferase
MLEIRDVDVHDEADLKAWFDAWLESQDARPPALLESWESARLAFPRPHPGFRVEPFAAFEGHQVVGSGLLNVSLEDNLGLAFGEVGVPPRRRRRGVGSALLADLERRARAAGRDRLLLEVFVPPGGETRDTGFAEHHGYAVANREGMKALDLDEGEARWPALEAEAAAARGDYRIVSWRDACPEEHLESYGAALGRVMSLIPQGELDLEDSEWTTERIQAAERRRVEIGTATIESVALAPDGTVVGLTGLRVRLHDPRAAHISVTMVLPEHRGHRLGLGVKLAAHRDLREQIPQCRLVVTSNSEVNTHMNAINDAMGYRRVETLLEYQRRL